MPEFPTVSPLPREAVQAVLFLADKLALAQQQAVARDLRMVDALADAAGMATFRHQPWYRDLTEAGAVMRLRGERAKRVALEALALVLKTDLAGHPEEKAYFTELRLAMGAPPVRVPANLEAHKRRVFAHLRPGGR